MLHIPEGEHVMHCHNEHQILTTFEFENTGWRLFQKDTKGVIRSRNPKIDSQNNDQRGMHARG
jgi:hypothetical protein